MGLERIVVLGLGKIGHLAAEMLAADGFVVTAVDAREKVMPRLDVFRRIDVADDASLDRLARDHDAFLSCLPYHLNARVATCAHRHGIHYFDLTEDVHTTRHIRTLAVSSRGVMAPQCGLAPGFIGIVGAWLAHGFDDVRSIRLRVGALPQHPSGLLGYAFNWSPEGVVNEYLNDCEVIEEGVRKTVSAMEWIETLHIDGRRLEAFTTSGGLGTMCETFAGRVANLDYKTIRYPGHVALMNFFFHELLLRERRDLAGEILAHAKPPVDADVVYVHAAAEGTADGRLQRREFVRGYRPKDIAGARRTAIAWTTAGSVVAVIDLVRRGTLPDRGFLKQEEIPFENFLATDTGRLFAETAPQWPIDG